MRSLFFESKPRLCAYFLIVSNTKHTSFKMAQMVGGLKLHDQVDDGARAAFHAVEAQIKQQAGVRHASFLVEQCLFDVFVSIWWRIMEDL